MPMYQLHKVDAATGAHAPITIVVLGRPQVVTVPEESVEDAYAVAEKHGARPIQRFEDGRVQLGHYMYVPEPEGETDA